MNETFYLRRGKSRANIKYWSTAANDTAAAASSCVLIIHPLFQDFPLEHSLHILAISGRGQKTRTNCAHAQWVLRCTLRVTASPCSDPVTLTAASRAGPSRGRSSRPPSQHPPVFAFSPFKKVILLFVTRKLSFSCQPSALYSIVNTTK